MNNNVLDWLEETAAEFPDKVAFSDSEKTITFGNVLNLSRAIGSELIRRSESNKPVAVLSGRNVMTPPLFLGIVYSGRAYAPMDGTMPVFRLNQILKTLDTDTMVVERGFLDIAESLDFNGEILVMEDLLECGVDNDALARVRRKSSDADLLYIIFTSGSTGMPKGVATSQHSLMCYIEAYSEVMDICSDDVLGNQSPLDYIAAIRDIYLPLYRGASTVIIPKELFVSPAKLFEFLTEHRVTSIGWSVSALTLPTSLGAFNNAKPEYLRKVCFSGSVMPCSCLRVWQENLPGVKFVNQYGPTEATASCTYYEVNEQVKDNDVLPIGVPYKNYRVFLLNEDSTATPQGEVGEICVSGPTLALGYYNDPQRSHDAFVQNPLNDKFDERIYKTGDLGLLRSDGILEFRGRKDRQIKHLGHRVELDEIEVAAGGFDGISDCCAVYNAEKEQIFLFYEGTASVRDIAVYLRKVLPGFMVPRKMVVLENLPRLANGKTDMKRLAELTK